MKKTKIPIPSEYAEQVAIFKLAQLYARQYPELRFLNGLFIELKRRKGRHIDPDQFVWQDFLLSQDYAHHFCRGSDSAWEVIINYLNLSK